MSKDFQKKKEKKAVFYQKKFDAVVDRGFLIKIDNPLNSLTSLPHVSISLIFCIPVAASFLQMPEIFIHIK